MDNIIKGINLNTKSENNQIKFYNTALYSKIY